MKQKMECPVCGQYFEIDPRQPGRPHHYCSKTCANIEKFYTYVMGMLEGLPMTPQARTYWKGRLFRDRNLVLK